MAIEGQKKGKRKYCQQMRKENMDQELKEI
jgi:hypothetical protein